MQPGIPSAPSPQGMPPGVSMGNIRAALMNRMGAGVPNPTPVQTLTAMPTGALPSGGPASPAMPTPQVPNLPTPGVVNAGQPVGPAAPAQALAKAGMNAQSPMFDQDTRDIAKALVTKLIRHI